MGPWALLLQQQKPPLNYTNLDRSSEVGIQYPKDLLRNFETTSNFFQKVAIDI